MPDAIAQSFSIELRSQVETSAGSGRFHTEWKSAEWDPSRTAIILCDMWDAHHSVTAVRRLTEFAPRVNAVIKEARKRGAAIIHAPSDCMPAYSDHPARKNALAAPLAAGAPAEIAAWCHRIPGEEAARYPIDQSDGGEDEDAWENEQWAKQMEAQGRNPGTPWKLQTPLIEIDASDYIAAEGDVVWNVLRNRNIRHVILAGVHTNMCVLGRPFGLRQMVRSGMDTALLRDCTDVMYNPARWPYVSHFTGLDLVINHIEANVCPTLTSDQIVGGNAFRFSQDHRPRVLMVIAEDEYESARTLPNFARHFLDRDFNVSYAFGSDTERHHIHGLRQAKNADVLLVSVRRRGLRPEDMETVREFVAAGKPVIGIRTASHAFAPNEVEPAFKGKVAWHDFDSSVFGGNYHGHHGNKGADAPASYAWVVREGNVPHPLLFGISGDTKWKTTSWLYKTSPLAPGTFVLMMGEVEGRRPAQPLAWTFTRKDGGRSFYTSLGHPDDFDSPPFQRLLVNAVYWATGHEPPETLPEHPDTHRLNGQEWSPVALGDLPSASHLRGATLVWLRTLVRAPESLPQTPVTLTLPTGAEDVTVYFNGQSVPGGESGGHAILLPANLWQPGQLNLITLQSANDSKDNGHANLLKFAVQPPALKIEGKSALLDGPWQCAGSGASYPDNYGAFPIPPQFGAPTDLIHNWPFD